MSTSGESNSKLEDWDGFLVHLCQIKERHADVINSEDSVQESSACDPSVTFNFNEFLARTSSSPGTIANVEIGGRPILGRGSAPIVSDDKSGNNCSSPFTGIDQKMTKPFSEIIRSMLLDHDDLDIEILRSDPDNPLHSCKTFQEMNLKDQLLRGVAFMGLYRPSMIQEKALPNLIGEKPQNMIAQSQSGTGKTATFLLTMLSRVIPEKFCQCLCMAPTRELALQIVDVGRQMARFMDVTFGAAVMDGEASTDPDGYVTDQIVIGTPGTVMQWARLTGPRRLDVSKLRVFVLDEADVMIEQGGFLNISKRIAEKLPANCQILLFSATYNDTVMEFARELVPNPIEIRVKRTQLSLKNIKQYYLLFKDWNDKYDALVNIYGGFDVGQAIIFCETRKEAGWLEGRMRLNGHRVVVLSGELEMWQRQQVIEQFREARFRVLITTNVCSRGLDIPQVNLVINWNMPVTRSGGADCETYLHRIGRSGRFGKEGLAINFITANEQPILTELETHFQIKIPLLASEHLTIL